MPGHPDQDVEPGFGEFGQRAHRPDPRRSADPAELPRSTTLVLPGKAKQRRIRDRGAAQLLPLRMPGEYRSVAVHERDNRGFPRQGLRAELHVLFQVQRCEQHELRLARFAPRAVGDLQDRAPGQAAERRLDGERVFRGERLLEITAVGEVQRPAGAQGIAKQIALRRDR